MAIATAREKPSPKLILHIGLPKTGSSALQSALAFSGEKLTQYGIVYPHHGRNAHAALGGITSGNLHPDRILESYDAAAKRYPDADQLLFSSEQVFSRIKWDNEVLGSLVDRGIEVRLIMLIRDPLPHAMSCYQQEVKRGGSQLSFAEWIKNYAFPNWAETILKYCDSRNVPVEMFNYSRHHGELLDEFCETLGVPAGTLEMPVLSRVNRSLTRSELYLQQRFSAAWGKESFKFVSDPLIEKLPEIASELPAMSPEAQQAFCKRMEPMIAQTNARLPPAQQYRAQSELPIPRPQDEEGDLTFSRAQIDVLAEAVAARLPDREMSEELYEQYLSLMPGDRITSEQLELLGGIVLKLRPNSKMAEDKLLADQERRRLLSPLARFRPVAIRWVQKWPYLDRMLYKSAFLNWLSRRWPS